MGVSYLASGSTSKRFRNLSRVVTVSEKHHLLKYHLLCETTIALNYSVKKNMRQGVCEAETEELAGGPWCARRKPDFYPEGHSDTANCGDDDTQFIYVF